MGFVLVLMHLAAPVLVPVLFAFFLAALAMPPFRALQRRGVKRGLALLLLIVALFGGGIALGRADPHVGSASADRPGAL